MILAESAIFFFTIHSWLCYSPLGKMMAVEQYLRARLRYRLGTKRFQRRFIVVSFVECIFAKGKVFDESWGDVFVRSFPVNFRLASFHLASCCFISNHRVNISRWRKRNIWEKVTDTLAKFRPIGSTRSNISFSFVLSHVINTVKDIAILYND